MKLGLWDRGNFAFLARTLLSLTGAGLIFFAVYCVMDKIYQWGVGSIGLVIGALGMYSSQAKMLNLFPFTSDPLGWRKAKQTYAQDQEQQTDSNNADLK